MRIILCFFLVSAFSLLEAKVNIFAHYFGQPEFIKYQYLFFKQNLLDEYEFVVFEDSSDPEVSEQIQNECKKYNIKYVHIPDLVFKEPKLPIRDEYVGLGAPSFQCAVATQYIYDNYVIPSENICLILDNDIFLLSPFSIEKYLGASPFSYAREEKRNGDERVFYMLPNFVIFNPSLMPEKERLDFNLGTIQGTRTDSGGYTHFYLLDYAFLGSEIPKYYLFQTSSDLKDRFGVEYPLLFNSEEWAAHYFLRKDAFLHMRMGSNWSQHPNYPEMKRELTSFFERLLSTQEGYTEKSITTKLCQMDHRNQDAISYVGTRPSGGRAQLELLLREGLQEKDYVLEIGFGALMSSIPIMSFLETGHYAGIDPNKWLMEASLQIPENQAIVSEKQPVFLHNYDFDGSSLGTTFDYIFAHSVMSHAADWQLSLFLENCAKVLKREGKVVFSLRLTEMNEFGGEGADRETQAKEWQYPGCSFFDKETVIREATQWFSKIEHKKEYTRILTENSKGVCHDWFVLTK